MVKRIAREWLWLLTTAITAIAASLGFHGAWWTVGETGVALVSLYSLSALIRTTIWAFRVVRRPATS